MKTKEIVKLAKEVMNSNCSSFLVKSDIGILTTTKHPVAGDTIVTSLNKDEIINNVIVSIFGDQTSTGYKKKRLVKDGKVLLAAGEYEQILLLFKELRKRTPGCYVSAMEASNDIIVRRRRKCDNGW